MATLCLLCAFAALSAEAKNECNKSVFDKCNEKLYMVGDDTFVFPKSISEMNKRCKELKRLESCVKQYASKCLHKESKQSVSVLSYGVTKTNRGYCSSGKRKGVFIRMASKCVTKNKGKLDSAMWQMSADFQAIARHHNDSSTKIPLMCCNYYKFKQNCLAVLGTNCAAEDIAEFETLIDGYTVDILSLLCTDYTEESDKCTKIIEQTPKGTVDLKAQSKTFVLPLVDVLDSL